MSRGSGRIYRWLSLVLAITMLASLVGGTALAAPLAAPAAPINFTILHHNDFHGQLEPSGSNPGYARIATIVKNVRTEVGADNVLLVDDGDQMQGSLLSNLQKGKPVIDAFNQLGVAVATFGNHEFDWGKDALIARTQQATYPYVSANIVQNDTGNCATAGWTPPTFAQPYVVKTVGVAPNQVKVGFVGVTTTETPVITIASATEGLCFKDPATSILHYMDQIKAEADVVVVLSHLGFNDGGYNYGIPVYGDKTLAQRLIDGGKPANLIVGGHSHTDVDPNGSTKPALVGSTLVVQAHYNGRKVGRADMTFDPATKAVTINWKRLVNDNTVAKDPAMDALIMTYVNDPVYQALINQPVGYAQVDLPRKGGRVDNMMATFIDDAIYNYLNTDGISTNDVDLFLNNAGGIRTDWCDKPDPNDPTKFIWSTDAVDCQDGLWTHDPMLLTYGMMFTILPFGNATVVGTMTGAEIMDVLNQAPQVVNGVIQPAGLKFQYFGYNDGKPGPQPWAWGALKPCVVNKTTKVCEPLDMAKTYSVGTNEFLAPAGGDNYAGFKYMKSITYWGDMLNAVNDWVAKNFTQAAPYRGPNGDGTMDGRIVRLGTDAGGPVIPVTILHHNDSHGRLVKTGNFQGLTQLATLVKQERQHNPNRTLLFSIGDNLQGDSTMFYFKDAGNGVTADGRPLPPNLWINPFVAVMNYMGYNGMVLGNHEFNFGAKVFRSSFTKAAFPLLGANMSDTGEYGVNKVALEPMATAQDNAKVNVYDGLEFKLDSGDAANPISLGVLGLTNHRVPQYELPSNIPGLSFTNPIEKAKELAPILDSRNDAVVAMTHIGFTTDPKSVEVDDNVDTNLAKMVGGIDVILGSHSHTNPTTGSAPYKYLPALIAGPTNIPVVVTQSYRYNTFLGEVVIGFLPLADGGYEAVSRVGRNISVAIDTAEDATVKAIVDPYQTIITAYNETEIGKTTVPIDTLKAFTEETNGANLQADASVWELERNGTQVDFHLSGAMTNRKIADTATPDNPYTLKVADMFAAMPYENSLLVMQMNGPELKNVLERAYRNYYFYKYVPGYGGYSYYTTCMLVTDKGNEIKYADLYPALPNGNNVVSFMYQGKKVDFSDANTYYNVSTVNYLAAGSCNFNDGGKTLWPLNQIVADTQLYVRDAVIAYVKAQTGPISPAIEGRLQFQNTPPLVTLTKAFGPAADTTLNRGQPMLAHGTWPLLYVGANDGLRAPVRFDLAAIPTSAAVDKAVLKFFVGAFSGGGSAADLQAFEITTPWAEMTATWNTPWTNKGGDFVATPAGSTPITKNDTLKWVTVDVTALAQKWVSNPTGNAGAMMKLSNETSFTQYRLGSREFWNTSLRPVLEVTYTAPMQ